MNKNLCSICGTYHNHSCLGLKDLIPAKTHVTKAIDVLGVAIVAFRNDDLIPCRILLGHRIKAEGYGCWVLPGGKLNDDETPEQGVRREGKEEANLEVSNLAPVHFEYNSEDPLNKYLMLYYTGTVAPASVELKAPHEFSELRWFHITTLPEKMWATDRNAIHQALGYWGVN